MSLEARKALVANPRLHLNDSQKADLLDPKKTDTWLIAALTDLLHRCQHPILITALNSDHPTYDGGPDGHGHNAGKACDCWIADWQSVGDNRVIDLMKALAECPYVYTVCYGGSVAQEEAAEVAWPSFPPFVHCNDNQQPHLHFQVQNAYGGPGLR